MRLLWPALIIGCAWGQNRESTTVNFDPTGNRVNSGLAVRSARADGGMRQTRVRPSANGREVPIDSVEERVLSDGPDGRVVERTVRRYDPDGNPGPPEKIRIEEKSRPDGGKIVVETLYRGDINGNLQLAERTTTESRKQGSTRTTDVVLERPTLNMTFEPVEKSTSVARERDGRLSEETSVYRKGISGQFVESARQTTERLERNGDVEANIARYEVGPAGAFQVTEQVQSRSRKAADGSVTEEINVYTSSPAGRTGNTQPVLKEQRLVETRPAGSGTVQSVSVRRPLDSDPGRLGPAQKVEETVCQGNCRDQK